MYYTYLGLLIVAREHYLLHARATHSIVSTIMRELCLVEFPMGDCTSEPDT